MWVNAIVKLLVDPTPRTTRTGSAMTTGFIGADIDGEDFFAFNVVAFGSIAEELALYKKGDTIALSGPLKENRYTNHDGEVKKSLQVVLDGIAGVKRRAPVQNEVKPRQKDEQERKPAVRGNMAVQMPF